MCRLLVILPVAAAVGCGYGFNPGRGATPPGKRPVEPLLAAPAAQAKADGTAEQAAILAALELLKAKSKDGYDGLKADAQPSTVKQIAGDVAAAMKGHDLGVAPGEFKTVWERHRKAWKALHTAVSRLPDAYEGTEFTDALTGLFKNDPTRGRSLGGDMVDAVRAVAKSHEDLYASAENYGLQIER
jgi:hypothetical protein